jgi:hypothetical protein
MYNALKVALILVQCVVMSFERGLLNGIALTDIMLLNNRAIEGIYYLRICLYVLGCVLRLNICL